MAEAPDRGRKLLFAIFTVSGFAGLIYESIWSHYLKLFLGHAAYAQTLVLAIFMGGMAIGSWIMSRASARIPNLLLGYALIEGLIGLLGLVFHRTSIVVTSWAFDVLLPAVDSVGAAQLSKWTLATVLILPQSVLLGMTFPLMSGAVVRRYPQRSGQTLAMLYFTNSLGAALGVLVSGFYLIGAVGLPGTIMTAGLLNIALALTVWGITKYQPQPEPATPPPQIVASTQPELRNIVRWMLIGAAVTGSAAFLYEIAWIRMLSLVLGSSTHSFELMLSAFILGIALGGLWINRRIDGLRNPTRYLGGILFVMAIVALVSLPVYNASFDLMAYAYQMFSSTTQGYVGFNIAGHVIAMLVMIPTTFFCGMTLPIMTNVLLRSGTGERAIGAIYAWNTAGAIVGVVVAVHVLMPTIGVKGIVISGAILQLVLGTAYLASASGTTNARSVALPAALGAAAVVATIGLVVLDPAKLTSGVFRRGTPRHDSSVKVLFLEHGKTATVSLVDADGVVSIATNGKPDAAIEMRHEKASPDEITMVLAGALPIAVHPNPVHVANIGIGSGLTTHVLLASDRVREVDSVEIEPLMAKAARAGFMPKVQRTFLDPRSHIYFEDAKTFFAVHRKKYDVIVSEPSNPWVSGVSTLFSDEFYAHLTRYLEEDGILVQWIQTYEADMGIVVSVIKALAPHFEDFVIYNADDSNLLIVATRQGTLRSPDASVFSTPTMRAELARVGVTTITDFSDRFLGNKRYLLSLMHTYGVPANSDYFPFVDLNAPKTRILKRNAAEFVGLQSLPLPFFELLEGSMVARGPTVLNEQANLSRNALVRNATAILDGMQTSRYDQLAPEATRMLLALRSSKEECAKPAVQRAWMDSVYFVAEQTTSVLNASELNDIWGQLGQTACAQFLAGQDERLFKVLHAIAKRDVGSIAQLGAELLASDNEFTRPAEFADVLIATAASQIATNQPQKALELIDRLAPPSPAPAAGLALRWLSQMAREAASAQPRPVASR